MKIRILFAVLTCCLLSLPVSAQDEAAGKTKKKGRKAKAVVKFKPYADSAPATEKWLHDVMEQPIVAGEFPGETPLSEVLDTISTFVTATYGDTPDGNMKMRIFPDQGEFGLEQILDRSRSLRRQ